MKERSGIMLRMRCEVHFSGTSSNGAPKSVIVATVLVVCLAMREASASTFGSMDFLFESGEFEITNPSSFIVLENTSSLVAVFILVNVGFVCDLVFEASFGQFQV